MIKKIAMSKTSKFILAAQIVFVVGVFSFVLFFSPSSKSPEDDSVITGNIISFDLDNAEIILIDDNPDFSSPIEINLSEINRTKIWLAPGVYYWKSSGVLESSVKKFTIPSEVGLELENATLKNSGNVPVEVTKETEAGSTGLVILDVESEFYVGDENETVYRGEENEE